jgi:hypothetical protein
MKYSALVLAANVYLLTGCTLESSGSEDVGEVSQALVAGSWVRPVLTPYFPAISDSGQWVCRGAGIPGRVSGTKCYYTSSSGAAASTTDYQNLAVGSDVRWEPVMLGRRVGSGIDWYQNPNVPAKVLSSNGIGVCEGKPVSTWYPGKFVGGNCKINNGSAEQTILTGMNSEKVRVLIQP